MSALLIVPATQADAAVTCPNANPVVNENNCMGAGSSAWQLTDFEPGGITGYATQSSVNLGSSVTLRIACAGGSGKAEVTVFRMGWYGGAGGRLVYKAKSVTINNGRGCEDPGRNDRVLAMRQLGKHADDPQHLPAGLGHLPRSDQGPLQRRRQPDHLHRPQRLPPLRLLYKLPDRHLPGLQQLQRPLAVSLQLGRLQHVTGTPKAVKVSFERPYANVYDEANWFLKADFPMVQWLERQGYDIELHR